VTRQHGAMEVTFRRAEHPDLPAIVGLLADDPLGEAREQALAGGAVDPAYESAFAAIDEDPRQLLVVAARGEQVVGTLQLSFIPSLTFTGGERAQVEGVRVAATERGRGLGRQMLAWSIDEARRRGCRMVQLTTNEARPDARRFYESLGFEATHVGMKLPL
jgi:GNAT superfamily N-acetyltransferase